MLVGQCQVLDRKNGERENHKYTACNAVCRLQPSKDIHFVSGLVGDEPRKYFGGLRLGNGWTGQWRWRRDPCLI